MAIVDDINLLVIKQVGEWFLLLASGDCQAKGLKQIFDL
jgi:hypothetical protein